MTGGNPLPYPKPKAACPSCGEDCKEHPHGEYACPQCMWEGECDVRVQTEKGTCPFCKSTSVDYPDGLVEDDDGIVYKAQCGKCYGTWNEKYSLDFIGNYTIDADHHPKNRE